MASIAAQHVFGGHRVPEKFDIIEARYTDEEYVQLAAIQQTNFPEDPMSPAEIREEDEQIDTSKFVSERLFARGGDGSLIGYIDFNHRPSRFHPQKFWIWMEVMPNFQNRGIGKQLYVAMEHSLKPHNPITFLAAARESMPHTLRFFEKRGFVEVSRTFESYLDVLGYDASKTADLEDVVMASLRDELANDSECLAKLYKLHTALGADVPSTDAYTPVEFETFKKVNIDHPNVLQDAYLIAKSRSEYVGESTLHKSQEQADVLTQEFTGVLEAHRRRGIAMALKLKTIEYAQSKGYKKIKTWNDSSNHGMLAINDALGFIREPAWIKYELDLTKRKVTDDTASNIQPSH